MKTLFLIIVAAVAAGLAPPALAADKDVCGAGMVCASNPQSVVNALQAAGYKASLIKSSVTGNPKIESAANGYNYAILFYECEKNAQCASLQFLITFDDDGANTVELANKWNKDKRFGQMAVNDDKSLAVGYDVTTLGGLTGKNFADVVDWWSTTLGGLSTFFKDNPAPKK